ncbi:MAG: prolyl oligopeptidase family serine peptidase [Salinivirgaceae bacterium]
MKKTGLLLLLAAFCLTAFSQKQVLSTSDFAGWKRIEDRQISQRGAYVMYELNAQKGDGQVIIYQVQSKTNDTVPLAHQAKFAPNENFVALKLTTPTDSIRKLKLAKTAKDKMPKDSLGIYILSNKSWLKYPDLISFQVPKEKGNWMAALLKHQEPKADTTAVAADTLAQPEKKEDKPKKKKSRKKPGKDNNYLLLINPLSGQQLVFNRVESYVLSDEGNRLALVSKINDTAKVFALITVNTETVETDTLVQDSLSFKALTFDKAGRQLAYLASADTVKQKTYALFLCEPGKTSPARLVDTLNTGLPKQWAPSENGTLYFSDDATKLYLGTAPRPKVPQKDTLPDDEKAKLDVWSWTDLELQPMQLKNLEKDLKQNYLAVYRIKEKKLLQLADTLIESVRLVNQNNGELALGFDSKPYARASSWTGKRLMDVYLLNLKTGDKKQVLRGQSLVHLSPNGKYVLWYNATDSSYYSLNTKTGQQLALTKHLPVLFCDELHDTPSDPWPYGLAGWASDDAYVLVYDRFDIWKLDPRGKQAAVNITNHWGRKNSTRLRYQKLDPDEVFISAEQEVILQGFNEETYVEGYYATRLQQAQNPRVLLEGNYMLGSLEKAKESDQLIWSAQTLSQYPDIKLSRPDFKAVTTLSQANPQQEKYNWATVELVQWKSFANDTLRGLLYKPEDFDPEKKYPMVVYFYERSSQDINRYYIPSPSRSIINKTFYASRGYLVFVPDIVYTTGAPGPNAYDAIVSGTQYLINRFPFVDAAKIGLQGQSWGGYQTAYLITRTDMFAAAMAGAPVSNMTSAYGGIRWGSGMSRMFQYEHTQSRIGGTLWEKPWHYIENSPLFYAPKVNTPLLMMHNDNDGAVPWYQGIEYFVALRRLDKPVWLLNYNGMEHNIESKYWANRMDLSTRMLQFFDHYLKGAPAPEWMLKGIPAVEKGQKTGY